MRHSMLAFAAVAVVISAPATHAQRGRGGPPGGGPPGARCAQTADSLTDSQKAQVRSLVDAYVAAHKPSLDSLRTIMEAARAAREAGKTMEEVRAIRDEVGRRVAELAS